MNSKAKGSGGSFRLADVFVVVFFLSIALLSLNLFRLDLTQTVNLRNVEPVGTVIVRRNTVQRRLSDRVLWDRLNSESPVYLGDLIRVADISAATLRIEGNSIELNENTLIRITRAPNGEGVQILLREGNLSLATGMSSGTITLDLNGSLIQTGPGTVLNAVSTENGVSVQISEGAALFVSDGQSREISSGNAIALDTNGLERVEKAVVVFSPAPNSRYLNNSRDPFPVLFLWNRINLESEDMLRMEIAADRRFSRIVYVHENLGSFAQTALDAGLWYWRLLLEDTVLSEGQLTVADGAGPELQSPAVSSVFRYSGKPDELPVLNFQWSQIEGASSYILEVSDSPNFLSPQIRRQGTSVFYIDSSLGPGTWYWRVMAVFPDVFIGVSSFSRASFFSIEQSSTDPIIQERASLQEWLVTEIPPELIPVQPPALSLTTPEQGAMLEGLTALRQQTVFQWECEAEITSSRFVLSREGDPFQGQPAMEIQNPGKIIRLDRLAEGTWYWNVEVQTADGFTVSAAESGLLQVLPIPLLPAPQNMQPARGYRFGVSELQSRRNIVFNWQAVQGANAYTFSLYQQTSGGRRLIVSTNPQTGTSYTFSNLRILDRGTFVWQVEALNRRGSVIEQRGIVGENTFVMDFPIPGPVLVEDTGVLYGN